MNSNYQTNLEKLSEPEDLAIDLETAKTHLCIDGSEEDTRVTNLILAAQNYIETQIIGGICLVNTEWRVSYSQFPCQDGCIELPIPPHLGVERIDYFDSDNQSITMDTEDYSLALGWKQPGRIWPSVSWPATYQKHNAVSVTFTSGYYRPEIEVDEEETLEVVPLPRALGQAILLIISDWDKHRGDSTVSDSTIKAVERILAPFNWGSY